MISQKLYEREAEYQTINQHFIQNEFISFKNPEVEMEQNLDNQEMNQEEFD